MARIRHSKLFSIQCFLILIYAFSITCKSPHLKLVNSKKQIVNKSRISEESNQRISANINETVVLGCNLEFPDNGSIVPYVIQWTKLNVKIPIFLSYEGYPPHTGDGYQGRTSLSGKASLQLSNVQESDQGWYECKIFFVNRPPEFPPKNGTRVHLDVHAPPHFKDRPPEVVYVKKGESVSLACVAQATPPPTTTWYKDNRPLEESLNLRIFSDASEIQIDNIQQTDIGEYQCSATNREGTINATTKLIIAGSAVITQQPTNLTKLEGEKAELSCEAKALPSNITYKWYFNGKSISQISSLDSRAIVKQNGMLQIHPVSAEDTGIFTCEVFNGIGVPQMGSAYVNVQFPARVHYSPIVQYLPLGMSGIVRCYVEANPPANQIAWLKDGLPFEPSASNGVISLNNGSLLFQRVTIDNQGMYKCTPYNEYGTSASGNTMEVLVKEPPTWITKPNEIYQQQVNSELHVTCAGKGTPKPTVSFRRADNGKLPKDRTVIHSGNFTLKALRKEDYGTYECVLSNEIATLVSAFMILVDSTTPHAPLNVQINTSIQAATVTWSPSYDGGYEQTYTIWYRMADQGDSDWKSIRVYPEGSTTFTLYNLVANTFYEFQVYSRNILGEGLPSPIIRAKTKDEAKVKPDPPQNVTITRVTQGYAISWLRPANSSVGISYYNIEYREGKDGESKFWGPIKKETSYLAKLKPGESYSIRVFSHSSLGVGSASPEIRFDVPETLEKQKDQAIWSGVAGGLLFFVIAIILSVCALKYCDKRKRRKTEKAYMMVSCPIMDARNVAHSQTGSPIPLKQYAKDRISSLINKLVEEIYYLTGYLPPKLRAKQATFKTKQEQALNQILRNHQKVTKKSKAASDQTDRGGFEEWYRTRNSNNHHYNNHHANRSIHRSHQQPYPQQHQPIPPIRKSKLLSAAIVNNKNSSGSQVKLIPNNSPVIATISSPNSTLEVRSHLIVHPSNDFSRTTPSAHHPSNQQMQPISPIPLRPAAVLNDPHHKYRQFRSAPQLPLKYGDRYESGHDHRLNRNLVKQTQFNQTFHGMSHNNNIFEPISFSPINVPPRPPPHMMRTKSTNNNSQVFARQTLPPSFVNHPQYFHHYDHHHLPATQNSNQHQSRQQHHRPQLPHSSTFISSPLARQSNSALRLRSLSAPEKVMIDKSSYSNRTQIPYFSPIANASFDQSSSVFGYNSSYYDPSFRRQHPMLIGNQSNHYNSALHPPSTPRHFYAARPDDFSTPRDSVPEDNRSLIAGSDSHRIQTINRMRLVQLAKENAGKRHRSSIGPTADYLRPIDYCANNDEFEADVEEDSNSLLFHKSLSKRLINRNELVNNNEELTTSSGRASGSSNLDNSPKIANDHKNVGQATILKSNSSSSGFASRTFSITGSPDKQQPIRLKKILLSSTNEASEADENYEFDLESRLNALYKHNNNFDVYKRSQSTTPLRFNRFDGDKAEEAYLINHQKEQLMHLQRHRAQQYKHIDHSRALINTPMSDENVDDYFMNDGIDEIKADEEIRILNDRTSIVSRAKRNYVNNLQENRHHLLQHHHHFTSGRSVFSDSELYDHQFDSSQINSREYMTTRYWRRIRCEQLKQELNEFRLKYNLQPSNKHETAC